MNQDNNWINDFVTGQLSAVKFETNWIDGSITVKPLGRYEHTNTVNYGIYDQIDHYAGEYVDKDEKIRDLEARVKELEAILEEEI